MKAIPLRQGSELHTVHDFISESEKMREVYNEKYSGKFSVMLCSQSTPPAEEAQRSLNIASAQNGRAWVAKWGAFLHFLIQALEQGQNGRLAPAQHRMHQTLCAEQCTTLVSHARLIAQRRAVGYGFLVDVAYIIAIHHFHTVRHALAFAGAPSTHATKLIDSLDSLESRGATCKRQRLSS